MPRKPKYSPIFDMQPQGLSGSAPNAVPKALGTFVDDFTGEVHMQVRAEGKALVVRVQSYEQLKRAAKPQAQQQLVDAKALNRVIADMLDPPAPRGPLKRRF